MGKTKEKKKKKQNKTNKKRTENKLWKQSPEVFCKKRCS